MRNKKRKKRHTKPKVERISTTKLCIILIPLIALCNIHECIINAEGVFFHAMLPIDHHHYRIHAIANCLLCNEFLVNVSMNYRICSLHISKIITILCTFAKRTKQ